METSGDTQYIIPASYRKMENMHIIFWLGKDIAWCMVWQPLGIAMIVPTLAISIIIAWRTRGIKSELAHNLAITFWITANSLWMISEFFKFDMMPIWRSYTGKHLALIPFSVGVMLLANYYIFQKPNEEKEKVVTM